MGNTIRILITGASGFLGRHLTEHYRSVEGVEVYACGRQALDVSSPLTVEQFFVENKIDVVLHTAIRGGKRTDHDTAESLYDNLQMYHNLKAHSGEYRLMINFGSGAEFDRDQNISALDERQVHNRWPRDFYGLAKNIITKDILEHDGNIVNLRLFGCFGSHEAPTRLIKRSILNASANKPIEIHKNKVMDFFWVEDLCVLIDHIISAKDFHMKDINVCYEKKNTLIEIGNVIKSLTNSSSPVILKEREMGPSYTGAPDKLASLGLNFRGLEAGIKKMHKEILVDKNDK